VLVVHLGRERVSGGCFEFAPVDEQIPNGVVRRIDRHAIELPGHAAQRIGGRHGNDAIGQDSQWERLLDRVWRSPPSGQQNVARSSGRSRSGLVTGASSRDRSRSRTSSCSVRTTTERSIGHSRRTQELEMFGMMGPSSVIC
jgi:hypothetical protein